MELVYFISCVVLLVLFLLLTSRAAQASFCNVVIIAADAHEGLCCIFDGDFFFIRCNILLSTIIHIYKRKKRIIKIIKMIIRPVRSLGFLFLQKLRYSNVQFVRNVIQLRALEVSVFFCFFFLKKKNVL